jgi:hypothetical protein
MASISQDVIGRPVHRVVGRGGLIDRYFYFAMSLVIAGVVISGFSQTVSRRLLHPAVPRPFLLWIHGIAFSSWVAFYIFQSALVRTHNVRLHRTLGWFGVALGGFMVPLGFAVSTIMARFDAHVLHLSGADAFLIAPYYDMIMMPLILTLAIAWRKKPELHRRLLFILTCHLTDAAWGRFPGYAMQNVYFYAAADALMLFGVLRDIVVDKRVHKVYVYTLPALAICQFFVMYTDLHALPWWMAIAHRIVG